MAERARKINHQKASISRSSFLDILVPGVRELRAVAAYGPNVAKWDTNSQRTLALHAAGIAGVLGIGTLSREQPASSYTFKDTTGIIEGSPMAERQDLDTVTEVLRSFQSPFFNKIATIIDTAKETGTLPALEPITKPIPFAWRTPTDHGNGGLTAFKDVPYAAGSIDNFQKEDGSLWIEEPYTAPKNGEAAAIFFHMRKDWFKSHPVEASLAIAKETVQILVERSVVERLTRDWAVGLWHMHPVTIENGKPIPVDHTDSAIAMRWGQFLKDIVIYRQNDPTFQGTYTSLVRAIDISPVILMGPEVMQCIEKGTLQFQQEGINNPFVVMTSFLKQYFPEVATRAIAQTQPWSHNEEQYLPAVGLDSDQQTLKLINNYYQYTVPTALFVGNPGVRALT